MLETHENEIHETYEMLEMLEMPEIPEILNLDRPTRLMDTYIPMEHLQILHLASSLLSDPMLQPVSDRLEDHHRLPDLLLPSLAQ